MKRAIKRCVDFVGALIGLAVFGPILAIVAIIIRLRMGCPILFRQVRPGLYGRPFVMYKFRTMQNLYDQNGKLLPDAERITNFGRFLRRTSLDEFPQLWNVLKGDMSLVGPRPLFTEYLAYYNEREQKRHLVRPGITGLAQVSGRNQVPWDKRLELDVQYIECQSLALDLSIMLRTVWKVLARSDVAEVSAAVEPSFLAYRRQQLLETFNRSDESNADITCK